NKVDLPPGFSIADASEAIGKRIVVRVSALEKTGIDSLRRKIMEIVTKADQAPIKVPELVPNARQKKLIVDARELVDLAMAALREMRPPELPALDLKQALDALGLITGETAGNELLDHIFSNFCLGK
ncbi:MAG: tRNA uridine-5-carboxymethylaminomethyl(34) synthesis GTPase MnmE, partial [Deltaproteobacteria bacterium]|nr:tRNA uridine-5-carboxymethylaminomethyl(34) synthesis GTPase MnmE [Deltaproteobacteria bacterium]